MAIIRWRPFWPFEEFDRFFEEFPRIWPEKVTGFVPSVDIYEEKGKIIVEAPITGIEPEKIDISIEDNVLTIKGKSEKKKEVEEKDYYRKEVRYGSFYRSVSLPAPVIKEKAEATYEDGLLKIAIPKTVEKVEAAKKIPVKIKK